MKLAMSEQKNIELWLQTCLRFFASDDLSLVSFSSSTISGMPNYTLERWQLAVDMIYRCVVSGLLEFTYPNYRDDHDAFCQAIRTRSPFDESGGVLWNWEQFYGTDKLVALVNGHFPDAAVASHDAVDPAFIQELKDIFAEHNVPWSDAPLLPIILNDHSAGA